VVLGGDVHYGGAFAMDWTGQGRTSRLVHLTSSAARNGWKDVVRNLMLLNGMSTGLQQIGMPMTRLGWTETLPEVVSDLATEPPLTRIRLQTVPVLLSDEFFREPHDLNRSPDWSWRAQAIVDERPPAERPPAARVATPTDDLPADRSAVRRYGDAAAMHSQALGTAAVARGLQFLNNAGLVTFTTAADGIHVRQALYSLRLRPDPNEAGAAYVLYDARVEPDPVPAHTRVGPGA
jgi:hypothetical protein